MSPQEWVARLAKEVREDLARLDRAARDLEAGAKRLAPDCDPLVRMGVAGHLHSFYTGCESILSRIARGLERMPAGPDWHTALLVDAAAGIEDVRPPVLAPRTAVLLHELLKFRHFFRTQYGIELDPDRLGKRVAEALEAHPLFRADIEKFLRLAETA